MATLVTGATGFLGGHVVRMLADEGRAVVATGRDPGRLAALQEAGIETFSCDLSHPDAVSVLSRRSGIESVVHAAALSAPWGTAAAFRAANVDATAHVLAGCRRLGVRRFVLISSPTLYFAFADRLGVAEDAALPPPVNAYAATKRRAEELALAASDLGPVVLRPRGLYGAGDAALMPRLRRAAARGPLPLLRRGRAVIDLTHVVDAAAAVRAALDAPPAADGRIYNVSGGEPLPVRHIVEAACVGAGLPPPRWRPLPLAPLLLAARGLEALHAVLPGRPEPMVTRYTLALFAFSQSLDISRAARELGWRPRVRFAEGLALSLGTAA